MFPLPKRSLKALLLQANSSDPNRKPSNLRIEEASYRTYAPQQVGTELTLVKEPIGYLCGHASPTSLEVPRGNGPPEASLRLTDGGT